MAIESPDHMHLTGGAPEKKTEKDFKQEAVERLLDRMLRHMEPKKDKKEETAPEDHASNDTELIKEIMEAEFAGMSTEQKAVEIYESVFANSLGGNQGSFSEYGRQRFQTLCQDKGVRQAFLDRFCDVRLEREEYRLSEMSKEVASFTDKIREREALHTALTQKLRVESKTMAPKEFESEIKKKRGLRNLIDDLKKTRSAIVSLQAAETVTDEKTGQPVTRKKYEQISENTDVAAQLMYETLREYREQNEKDQFIWFPSKQADFETAMKHIDTGKAPLGIGPSGTGKSSIFESIAKEATGEAMVRIRCHPGMAEEGLIYTLEVIKGTSYRSYKGTATEALTGFLSDKDTEPKHARGLLVCFDELDKLSSNKAKGPINDILDSFQKVGKFFDGKLILDGAIVSATANEPLTDEAIERRFARIPMDYLKMTEDNPEVYELFLVSLMHQGGHLPAVRESLLKPAYKTNRVSETDKEKPGNILRDGSVKISEEELIADRADKKHGFLYRLAYAVRAIQDAYIHGSKFNEKHLAKTAFFTNTNDESKLEIVTDGYKTDFTEANLKEVNGVTTYAGAAGEMMKLRSGFAAITAGAIHNWFKSYNGGGRNDLVTHIRGQLDLYISQLPAEEQERVRLILDYFKLYDEKQNEIGAKPDKTILTPKDIGYLSPRVPRPYVVESPNAAANPEGKKGREGRKNKEASSRNQAERTVDILTFEDDARLGVTEKSFALNNGVHSVLNPGDIFIVGGEKFVMRGVVEDGNKPENGALVGKLAGAELYRRFSADEVDRGLVLYFSENFSNKLDSYSAVVDEIC